MSNCDLAVQFFVQIAVILIACRAVGAVASKMGQPQVVAEIFVFASLFVVRPALSRVQR